MQKLHLTVRLKAYNSTPFIKISKAIFTSILGILIFTGAVLCICRVSPSELRYNDWNSEMSYQQHLLFF